MADEMIVDRDEVLRWFSEGRSYIWMCEEYERKYNRRTTMTMWGNFRRRNALLKRLVRDRALFPWPMEEHHHWSYAAVMLRAESRLRADDPRYVLDPSALLRLKVWKDLLAADDLVVHYDPETHDGFSYVARRSGIDLDLIREPVESS